MSFHDDLLLLFAKNRAAKIDEVPEYQRLCREYEGDKVFERERSNVELKKTAFEVFVADADTLAKEVEGAISALVAVRSEPDTSAIYRKFIAFGYKQRWSLAQQQYFDEAWKKISLKYDFFLSFTTRYEDVPGDNPVNSNYRYFIQHVLGEDEFKNSDRKKENLLAKCVYRYLGRVPLAGFYFPHSKDDNSVIEEKLARACADSRVFVQLVQNVIFMPRANRQNYCFFEYQKMVEFLKESSDKDRRILFVIAEKDQMLLNAILVPLPYKSWHKHISAKAAPYLAAVDLQDKLNRIEDLQKSLEDLHKQVEGELIRLTQQIPI